MSRRGAVRPAGAGDLALLAGIEVAAGALFAGIGMHDVADDEPPTVEALRGYQADGRAWVAVDGDDRPVGYALALEVDGNGHLEQLSVHPAAGRQGLGRSLVEAVAAWAAGRGATAVTLSTFRDVPWNAPYYERLGFRVLPEQALTPGLLALRAAEEAHGLDTAVRVFMRRDL